MSDPARELYVYYRVAPRDLVNALGIAARAQARLRADHATLSVRLLRRADEVTTDAVTLMEIYRAANGIDDALQRRIEEVATEMAPLLIGERHVEPFVPLSPLAD